MLLLAGTCIVEEAVLTGESHPQWKTPIGNVGQPQASTLINLARSARTRLALYCARLLQGSVGGELHPQWKSSIGKVGQAQDRAGQGLVRPRPHCCQRRRIPSRRCHQQC